MPRALEWPARLVCAVDDDDTDGTSRQLLDPFAPRSNTSACVHWHTAEIESRSTLPGGALLFVRVPTAWQPGEGLEVRLAEGRHFRIAVPRGALPGATLCVCMVLAMKQVRGDRRAAECAHGRDARARRQKRHPRIRAWARSCDCARGSCAHFLPRTPRRSLAATQQGGQVHLPFAPPLAAGSSILGNQFGQELLAVRLVAAPQQGNAVRATPVTARDCRGVASPRHTAGCVPTVEGTLVTHSAARAFGGNVLARCPAGRRSRHRILPGR